MADQATILVLYFSKGGHTASLARLICRGIEAVDGAEALCRTVPAIVDGKAIDADTIPEEGAPYVTQDDLIDAHALALGSPCHFGNMAAPMKHFLDQTTGLWFKGSLTNKPACVFTCTTSMHGGQESTLLSMMIPLLHHGMMILGLPFSQHPELSQTLTGCTPYGASLYLGPNQTNAISEEEKTLAIAQGTRLAKAALAYKALHTPNPK